MDETVRAGSWELIARRVERHKGFFEASVKTGGLILDRVDIAIAEGKAVLVVHASVKNVGDKKASFTLNDVAVASNKGERSTAIGYTLEADLLTVFGENEDLSAPISVEPGAAHNAQFAFIVSDNASGFVLHFVDLRTIALSEVGHQ